MRTQDKKYPAFADADKMPFGKYRGEPMQDVPATYLRWMWNEFELKQFVRNYSSIAQYNDSFRNNIKIANYIWNSKDSLEEELGDTL